MIKAIRKKINKAYLGDAPFSIQYIEKTLLDVSGDILKVTNDIEQNRDIEHVRELLVDLNHEIIETSSGESYLLAKKNGTAGTVIYAFDATSLPREIQKNPIRIINKTILRKWYAENILDILRQYDTVTFNSDIYLEIQEMLNNILCTE